MVTNLRMHQMRIGRILNKYSQLIPVASPTDVISKLNTLIELILTKIL